MPLSTPARRPFIVAGLLAALCLGTCGPTSALDRGNHFCGAAVSAAGPGDLSLEYAVQQPASMLTCSMGYFLEKCGDHENAHKVFDKCIAAGYVGAMIWKALLLDEGAGVEQDLPKAAELLHRAAVSGDPAYGPLGKMHYATVLHLGRGVEKNEAEALTWFQAAAAEGSGEAREFLKTGYHTGYRDLNGLGAGTPTAAALAPLLTSQNDSQASRVLTASATAATGQTVPARKLLNQPESASPLPVTPLPSAQRSPLLAADIQGQRLAQREPLLALPRASETSAALGLLLLLLGSFLVGLLRQKRQDRTSTPAL